MDLVLVLRNKFSSMILNAWVFSSSSSPLVGRSECLSISQVVLKMKIQEVRKRNKKDDKDNISEFPDHVLLHIMSLMDTKSAVRTCVLSKRWKDLCKRLTNLTFSSSIGSCKHSMIQFLSWILSIRDHSYSLLNLSIDNHKAYIKPEVIDCVVKYALFHNVQQLKLVSCTETEPNLEPLTSIFCSQSLKSLELAIILDTLGEVNIFIYGDGSSWNGKSSIIIKWLQVLANDLSNPSSTQPPCFVRLESLKVKKQLFTSMPDEDVNKVVEYLLQNTPMAKVDVITNA
ncbi:putative FBD-associated F-box protein [Glycine soja]